MDIFIQSRGFEPNKDYTCLHIKANGDSQRSQPPISSKTASLIQGDSPSIAIERLADRRLLLLVTGIETKNRLDFHDREIRISAIWVAKPSEEKAIRRFSARILSPGGFEMLTKRLDEAVFLIREPEEYTVKPEYKEQVNLAIQNYDSSTSNIQTLSDINETSIRHFAKGQPIDYKEFIILCQKLSLDWQIIKNDSDSPKTLKYGFDAKFQNLLGIALEENENELIEDNPPTLKRKIGWNSPELRTKLAQELKKYRLPDSIGPIVIVTGFKKRLSLEESGAWRSLSTLVNSNDWDEVEEQYSSTSQKNILTLPVSEVFQHFLNWLKL